MKSDNWDIESVTPEALRAARGASGITLLELSRASGIPTSTISRIECGEFARLEKRKRLRKALIELFHQRSAEFHKITGTPR